MYEFSLSEKEKKTFEVWKNDIKKVFGEYGSYSFTFTPTGIGNTIEVYSHLAKITKDITDINSW